MTTLLPLPLREGAGGGVRGARAAVGALRPPEFSAEYGRTPLPSPPPQGGREQDLAAARHRVRLDILRFVQAAPAIYTRLGRTPSLNYFERLVALGIATAAIAVLITAASLHPDASGMGTHQQLHLQPCGFLMRTGLPCAGCGMTTSFAYGVRLRLLTSFLTQPFGMILCVLTAASFWGGLYVAVTGRAAYRLLAMIPFKFHVAVWPSLALVAWLYKIVLVIG